MLVQMGSLKTIGFILCAIDLFFAKQSAGEEFCISESVNIICPDDEVVSVESAFLGRWNNSRCYNRTSNERNCKINALEFFESRFLQQRSISIALVDPGIYRYINQSHSECNRSLQRSLEISYRCMKVEIYRREVCLSETFRAQCESSVAIQSGLYGRMRRSRCLKFATNDLNCSVDVQSLLKSRCDGQKECNFSVSAPNVFNKSSCNKSLEQYLEVTYSCLGRNVTQDEPGKDSSIYKRIEYFLILPLAVIVFSIVAIIRLRYRNQGRCATESRNEERHVDHSQTNDISPRQTDGFILQNDMYTEYKECKHVPDGEYGECKYEPDEEYGECKYEPYREYGECKYEPYREYGECKYEPDGEYGECKYEPDGEYSILRNTGP